MADCKGDDSKRPIECGRHPMYDDENPRPPRSCPHLKEMDPNNMDGETYDCKVCGEHFYLDYDEMR